MRPDKADFLRIFGAHWATPTEHKINQLGKLLASNEHYLKHFKTSVKFDTPKAVYCFKHCSKEFHRAFKVMILLTLQQNWELISEVLDPKQYIEYTNFSVISQFNEDDYDFIKHMSFYKDEVRQCVLIDRYAGIIKESLFACIKVVFDVHNDKVCIVTVFPMKTIPDHYTDRLNISSRSLNRSSRSQEINNRSINKNTKARPKLNFNEASLFNKCMKGLSSKPPSRKP